MHERCQELSQQFALVQNRIHQIGIASPSQSSVQALDIIRSQTEQEFQALSSEI